MVTNDSDADNHLRDDVNTALVRHDPLLQFGRQFIQVAVENGVVTLRGNVRNITHKNIAAERAQDVDGVAGVRNLLVDDGELLRLVGTALAAHPETSATVHGPIETFLGVVTLRGPAPSPEFAEQAPMLAAQVPGARLVLDQINAEIDDTEPSVEAVFGRRVILGGHEAGRVREVLIDRVGSQVQGVVISHGKLPSVWATLPPSVCGLSDSRYLYLDMTESEFSELPVDIHARPAGADRSALVLDRRTCVGSSWNGALGGPSA